jgi:hypothetical protein
MGTGEGHLIQLAAVHRDDDSAGFLGFCGKALQTTVGITVGDEYFIDGTAGSQCFG